MTNYHIDSNIKSKQYLLISEHVAQGEDLNASQAIIQNEQCWLQFDVHFNHYHNATCFKFATCTPTRSTHAQTGISATCQHRH